jgi:hypothetical protein
VEVTAEAMEGALDSFVAIIVNRSEDLLEERGARRDVEAPLERYQAINEGPGSRALVGGDLLDGDQHGVLIIGLPKVLDEVKSLPRESQECRFLGVTAGQGISHCIVAARLVLHGEVEAH